MKTDTIAKVKEILPQVTASLIASSFSFCFGAAMTYSAVLIAQLQKVHNSTADENSMPITDAEASWIVTIGVLSMVAITIFLTLIIDTFGRINSMRAMIVPFIFGHILIATSTSNKMVLAGRAISLGASACFPIASAVYISEISLPSLRGSLLSYKAVCIALGMFLTYLKGKYLHWRIIPYIISGYATVAVILSTLISESEVWLTLRQKIELEKNSTVWFQVIFPTKEHFNAFRKPTFRKPLLIIVGFYLFQNLSGSNVVFLNLVTFFNDFGTGYDPYSLSIYAGLAKFLINIGNTWTTSKFNRRSVILFSFTGMGFAISASATSTMLINDDGVVHQWVAPVMLIVYTIFLNMGVMFMPYLISSELCPGSIRGTAHSISFGLSQLITFGMFHLYYLVKGYCTSWQIQYFFGLMSFVGVLYTYLYLPETHNKTLVEIEDGFCRHGSIQTPKNKPNEGF